MLGDAEAFPDGPGHAALLIGAGLITAAPLLLFSAAAARIPLATLGLLQYLTPTLQFRSGCWSSVSRLGGPSCWALPLVWSALAVFVYDAVAHNRRPPSGPT